MNSPFTLTAEHSSKEYCLRMQGPDELRIEVSGHIALGGSVVTVFKWEGTMENAEANQLILRKLAEICRGSGGNVQLDLTEARLPLLDMFQAHGFACVKESWLFRLKFQHALPPVRLPLELRHHAVMDEASFAQLFKACSVDEPNSRWDDALPSVDYWRHFRQDLDNLFVPEWTFAVKYESEYVGVLLFRRAEAFGRNAGFMNFIGVAPGHRGRGIGAELHQLGLHWLRAQGCTEYIGGTDGDNVAMQGVMRRNGVEFRRKQVFLRPPGVDS